LLFLFALVFPFHNSAGQGLIAPPEPLIPQGIINSGKAPSNDSFAIAPGYKVTPVLWNLTIPSTVTFDDNGSMYVAESGFSYGGLSPLPRILKVGSNGNVSVLADRGLNGPITDMEFNNNSGVLYVSHKGLISAVDLKGHIKDLVAGLPSGGDHHNNQIAFGPDGRFYFGQGTVTNSGVVGDDNYAYEWLKISPELHDIPGQNISLTGQNFKSINPLTPQNLNDYALTGAFIPFNHTTTAGQTIKGDIKCSGCIISSNANGTDLKLVAWGLRNPYGVTLSLDHKNLFVANNGADERGSRRVGNDSDKVFKIDISNSSVFGKWYGWPDYFGDAEPSNLTKFISESSPNITMPVSPLLKNPPKVEKPYALLGEGVALTQAATSVNDKFGYKGKIFLGEFGTAAPLIHPFAQVTQKQPGFNPGIIGQKVVVMDPVNKTFTDFLALKKPDKSFHPVGVKFNGDGNALYVVSYGKTEIRTSVPASDSGIPGYKAGSSFYPFGTIHAVVWPYLNDGVVWKITKASP
jgi:glucose/arabinose dehydrogenase